MNIDSARANLASTFVNAFVNTGFARDSLILDNEEDKWIYRNKEHGVMSAVASMGLLLLWDFEGGLSKIDVYAYSENNYVKAGALLGFGIVNSTVRSDNHPALALLAGTPGAIRGNSTFVVPLAWLR